MLQATWLQATCYRPHGYRPHGYRLHATGHMATGHMATGYMLQATWLQAAGSRQQAAGSRQQAAGSRQQAAGSRQQAAGRAIPGSWFLCVQSLFAFRPGCSCTTRIASPSGYLTGLSPEHEIQHSTANGQRPTANRRCSTRLLGFDPGSQP
jgi:hypothetical protein